MNYYLINLLTVLLFQPTLISCIGSINILPALPFGQYNLIFKHIRSCAISQDNEVQYNLYLSHNPKSNATEVKGNITTSIQLDDTLFLELNFAMKDADGHWKENTYIHKSPNACSSFRNLMGTEWTKIMNGLGVKKATCPIPPGIYTTPGLDTSIFLNINRPKTFIYETYKIRFFFSRFKGVYGCTIFVIEFKPL
eukprot:XP_016657896.1 PREDICTED: uncharacterized protein LOC100572166 isoform X2 [Acyrthosiphon pisum]